MYIDTNICSRSNFDISKIFESGDQFKSTITKKKYRHNFPFQCNMGHIKILQFT